MTAPSQTMTTEWEVGEVVRIKGSQGLFKVKKSTPNKDGSISLYGGDKNPNGNRGFRDVMPARLIRKSGGK